MQGIEADLTAGDVQATLRWRGDADLDLYVLTPSGDTLFYGNRRAADGAGRFDVDIIPQCANPDLNVENVGWPANSAPAGEYAAWARLYSPRDCGALDSGLPIDFTLVLKVTGQEDQSLAGVFDGAERGQASERLTATVA